MKNKKIWILDDSNEFVLNNDNNYHYCNGCKKDIYDLKSGGYLHNDFFCDACYEIELNKYEFTENLLDELQKMKTYYLSITKKNEFNNLSNLSKTAIDNVIANLDDAIYLIEGK